jgi:hypothetical protein
MLALTVTACLFSQLTQVRAVSLQSRLMQDPSGTQSDSAETVENLIIAEENIEEGNQSGDVNAADSIETAESSSDPFSFDLSKIVNEMESQA